MGDRYSYCVHGLVTCRLRAQSEYVISLFEASYSVVFFAFVMLLFRHRTVQLSLSIFSQTFPLASPLSLGEISKHRVIILGAFPIADARPLVIGLTTPGNQLS